MSVHRPLFKFFTFIAQTHLPPPPLCLSVSPHPLPNSLATCLGFATFSFRRVWATTSGISLSPFGHIFQLNCPFDTVMESFENFKSENLAKRKAPHCGESHIKKNGKSPPGGGGVGLGIRCSVNETFVARKWHLQQPAVKFVTTRKISF